MKPFWSVLVPCLCRATDGIRIHFKMILFAFEPLKGRAPLYLTELLHHETPSWSLRSADQLLLGVLKTGPKLWGDQMCSVAAPKLWNELPLLISHLFSLAFHTTWIVHLMCIGVHSLLYCVFTWSKYYAHLICIWSFSDISLLCLLLDSSLENFLFI